MNTSQKKAFWAIYVGFLITATIFLYFQGAFKNIDIIGLAILFAAYMLIAFGIHKFVEKNPDEIDKWFY